MYGKFKNIMKFGFKQIKTDSLLTPDPIMRMFGIISSNG